MAETQSVQAKPTFTTIQFVTKDGEKCTATKNNGIVTVRGDKNGVRQLPVDQFMKELIETLPKNVNLERTPNKDKVQFSGNEEPAKTEPDAADKAIDETNKKLNKKYFGIAAAALAVVGTGIYLLGRGKWWSKAAKEAEKKGQELVDDAVNGLKDGIKENTQKADDIVEGAENLFIAKSPIPKEQILEMPKDLETDVEKIVKQGREVARGFDTANKGVDTVTYTISTPYGYRAYRVTEAKGKPIEIKSVLDYGEDSRPFRTFEFENGQVRSIADNTTKNIHKRFLKVEKKANPVEELKLPKSPIPESELLEIPKDFETEFIKVVQNGHCQNVFATEYLLKSPDGLTKRLYSLNQDTMKIESVAEYANDGIKPFRKIYFTDGQVSKIEDLTSATPRIKEFKIQKPQQPQKPPVTVPEETKGQPQTTPNATTSKKPGSNDELFRQQDAERLRQQKEQEAIDNANNDIINAAIIADMASATSKKGAQEVAERAGESLADDATNILRPQQVAEEGEQAAKDIFAHNSTHYGETPIRTSESEIKIDAPKTATNDIFNSGTDDIIPPASTFGESFVTDASEIKIETPEMPKITYEETFGTDLGDAFDDFGSMFG